MAQNPFRCMMLEGLLFSQFANAAAAAMTAKARAEQERKMKEDAEKQRQGEANEDEAGAFNKEEVMRLAREAEERVKREAAEAEQRKIREAQEAEARRQAEEEAKRLEEQIAQLQAQQAAAAAAAALKPQPTSTAANCTQCGCPLGTDFMFCPKCGKPRNQPVPDPATAVAPAAPQVVDEAQSAAMQRMKMEASRAAIGIAGVLAARDQWGAAAVPSVTDARGSSEAPVAQPSKANQAYVDTVLGHAQQAATAAAEANRLAATVPPLRPGLSHSASSTVEALAFAADALVEGALTSAEAQDRERRERRRSKSRKDRSKSRRRSRSRSRRGRGDRAHSPSPRRKDEVAAAYDRLVQMQTRAKEAEGSRDRDQPIVTGATVDRVKRSRGGGWDSMQVVSMPTQAMSRPPMVSHGTANHKVLRLPAIQIRALLGKGGQTINDIRNRSGADIKIHHPPQDEFGQVSIVGNIDLVESLMTDALISKGCAGHMLGRMMAQASAPPAPTIASSGATDLNDDEVPIAGNLVGLFIGPQGTGIKEIKEKVQTGAVFISVGAPKVPGGPQLIQVTGSGRREAVELIRARVNDLSQSSGRM